jgi:transcriptional regulator with XRE-family HTH domain
MTQDQLSKKLKITRPYLNSILNGKRKPSKELALKISKLTGKKFIELRPDIIDDIKRYL